MCTGIQPFSPKFATPQVGQKNGVIYFIPNINRDTAMPFFLEHFVRFSIMFLLTMTLCMATIQSVTTTFTEKRNVATSHTTLHTISRIKCVEKCNKERQTGGYTLAGYNKATKTCYLSVDNPQDVVDIRVDDEMSDVFFFGLDPRGMYNMFYLKYDMQ